MPETWRHGPVRPVPPATVHQLFERQAAAGPDRTAVSHGDHVLTYRELDRRAEQLSATLRARGAGTDPTAPVAVWMPRGADLVVALLAVLKSGRPYVPLDPALGRARAESVVAEAAAPILLVPAPGAPGTPDVPGGTIVVGVREHAPADAVIPAVPPVGPDAPCYVIYTSGSTGRPKGVVVPHRAVVNVCQWHHRRFACTPADRSALLCSPSFDASVLETWPALTAGASVVVADDDARRDAKALARWYTDQRITFTMLPTALAETLLELAPADQPPLLRHCAAGGDVLRTRPRPGTGYEVVNIYGPTEVTVLCTHQGVPPAADQPPLLRHCAAGGDVLRTRPRPGT
ncbi:AMP-binding protein, partial [Streptomyces otsuchiensis]|uniref:AMP-binding protein n=1 Tax=Streptomyces otsuchiensis TaxID=2681388 RepID=UPI001D132529